MKQSTLLYLVLCCAVPAFSQEPRFSINFYQGISRAITNSGSFRYSFGHSWALGSSAKFQKKNSAVFFQPAVMFTKYGLNSRLNESMVLKASMRCLSLMPLAGLQVNPHFSVQSGLLFLISHTQLEAVFRQNSSYQRFSNNHLYGNFTPKRFHAGPVLQLSGRGGESGKLAVHLLLQYVASPFLKSDYTVTIAGSSANNQPVFTRHSTALGLCLGVEYRFAVKKQS